MMGIELRGLLVKGRDACSWMPGTGTSITPLLKHGKESVSISRQGGHRHHRQGSRPNLLRKSTPSPKTPTVQPHIVLQACLGEVQGCLLTADRQLDHACQTDPG